MCLVVISLLWGTMILCIQSGLLGTCEFNVFKLIILNRECVKIEHFNFVMLLIFVSGIILRNHSEGNIQYRYKDEEGHYKEGFRLCDQYGGLPMFPGGSYGFLI